MAENEKTTEDQEDDNTDSKKTEIKISEQDMKAYLDEKFNVHPLPGENVRKKTVSEMLNDAENHK